MQLAIKIIFLLISLILFSNDTYGQTVDEAFLQRLKEDTRGPYAAIKWFCEDGTRREARDPCPEPMKGWQHAIYKNEVEQLASRHHIFLDQILTGTDKDNFWDEDHQNSRLKQYQITNFLFDSDDGWILEKAKNYRGAKQIEDEKEWGQEFLEWLVANKENLKDNYLLIKLAAVDIPHGEDTRVAQRVRAYSKLLADEHEDFMETRIRIHNNPSKQDITLVKNWKKKHSKLKDKAATYYDQLLEDLIIMYKPFEVKDLSDAIKDLSAGSFKSELNNKINNLDGAGPALIAMETCDLLLYIRENILEISKASDRLILIDFINEVENLAMQNMYALPDGSVGQLREKICFLSNGIYGAGYIEDWEYKKIKYDLDWFQAASISIEGLEYFKSAANKLVLWSSQMVQSIYSEPVQEFGSFEPLTYGFVDDKIRSSLILPAGDLVERLNKIAQDYTASKSEIMGLKNSSGMQSLNPGIAKGRLYVLETISDNMELDKSGIYAFDRPPTEMKPVAGILNVKEGNPVSHVQLLARNLGIPNALISGTVLDKLQNYDGKEVFYAVSPGGSVVLKLAKDMSDEEVALFSKKARSKQRITIATDKIILHPDSLLDMSKIDATYSGKWCGPKAANLGQLKQLFPKHVVEGIVIPFGIFKDHMDQKVPEKNFTYWDYLNQIFTTEQANIQSGCDPKDVETETLWSLGKLRAMIEKMPLKQSLVNNMENHFKKIFEKNIGDIPVFLRSDTNMEDLPQFTGAGLNLTLFNVLDHNEILQGIKKVWASPYSERSYQWRQQYLENPEEVYPSILIIPSVNVDCSGVIITKGVNKGGEDDISISFSRGVGGAVEGQSAESYVIYKNGFTELISPGRETKYRVIPPTGGSTFTYAALKNPVLNKNQIAMLNKMAQSIESKMDNLTNENHAYDIELGIKDDFIWLFQVRPFVENKEALGSEYLRTLDPEYIDKQISMDETNKK